MDYYGIDDEDLKIKSMLAQAAALRGAKSPRGQMVGSGQFQHYVAPSIAQHLTPLGGQIAGQALEDRAGGAQSALNDRRTQEMSEWIGRRPGDDAPDAEQMNWASGGMANPISRGLAQSVLQDQVVQAPIRRERAEDRKQTLILTNQRYEEDRKARAALEAQRSADRMQRLEMQLNATNLNQQQRLQVQQEIARERMNLDQARIDAGVAKADKDRTSRELVARQRAQSAEGKSKLSSTQQKELSELGGMVEKLSDLNTNFKDDYTGGYAWAKNLAAPYGSLIPKQIYDPESPQNAASTEYWRQYDAIGNFERHELFGSALTKVEQEAWKKQALPATATPTQIRASNAARLKILQNSLQRKLDLYEGGSISPQTGKVVPRSALPMATTQLKGPSNDDRVNLILQEAKTARPEDRDELTRELGRLGYKGPIDFGETSAPAAAPAEKKRLKFNPATGKLE